MPGNPRTVRAGDRSPTPRHGKSGSLRVTARNLAVSLACAALITEGMAGCTPTASGDTTPASAPSSSACEQALQAVSTYGPTVLRNAVSAKEAMDKVEISLLVYALDAAAGLSGTPGVKKSIRNLANAYSDFRDRWTNAAAPPSSRS